MKIETCRKCGHKWIKQCRNPKRCPACSTCCWAREKLRPGRVPKYKFPEFQGDRVLLMNNQKAWQAFSRAKAKNPELVAKLRPDGILVSWPFLV